MCHTDNTDKHSCNLCKEVFTLKSNLQRHEEAHHRLRGDIGYIFSEEKQKAKANINCDFCNKSFTRKSNLNAHIKGFHKLATNSAKTSINFGASVFLICDSFQDDSSNLSQNDVDMTYNSGNVETNERNGQRTKIPCEHCGKVLSGKLSFDRHIKLIHGDQKLDDISRPKEENKCDKCGKLFSNKKALRGHS